MTTLPARSKIAPEYTWNAPSLFASDAAWSAEYAQVTETLTQIPVTHKGHLGDNGAAMLSYLNAYDAVQTRIGKLWVYASMLQAVDSTVQSASAMVGQMMSLFGHSATMTSFAEPEMLALGKTKIDTLFASDPALKIYQTYFENLFRLQAHVRSGEVEEVIGILSDPMNSVENTFYMLTNADMVFNAAQSKSGESLSVAQGTMTTLVGHADREVRRTGWQNYCDEYLAHKNTLANNLLVNVKRLVAISRVRGYGSALESTLFPTNIPHAVVHNLVETYKKHLPTWHKYWGIKRRALGVETLHHYDIWAPMAKTQPKITYHEAVDMISEGMKPLGSAYVETLRKGCLQDRWVDVYPNQGKAQGAFSTGVNGSLPFIMMSFNDSLVLMSTLAHELGHSMHSYLTWQNQPVVYSNYSLFAAEVASNFNQALVRANLFKTHTDRDFQIALIEEAMSNFHRYFFIMPTLTRFELEIHARTEQGKPITSEDMINLMADLFTEGYGGEMEVDRQREGITWAQFPHLYANFYVYAYATGIAGAHALADRVLTGGPKAAEDYLGFLKAGGSLYPLDALKRAGVDLTTPEPVEKTFAVLADLVDRLDKLV